MVGIHRHSHNFLLNEVNDLAEMIPHNRKVVGGRKLMQNHHDPNLMKKCLANLLLGKLDAWRHCLVKCYSFANSAKFSCHTVHYCAIFKLMLGT